MGRSGPERRKKEADLRDEEFIDSDENAEADDGPPSIEPYDVLGLEREATADEVKSAYKKMALKHHPDKVLAADKEDANQKFQEIAFAYAVLSDPNRRRRFDLTGSTAEVLEGDDDFDWLKFYREQFEDVVNEDNINRIKTDYKGGEEEKQDLLNAYTKFKGRFSAIYQTVMLSDILEDDDRFRQIINEEIAAGNLELYPNWKRDDKDELREKAKEAERKQRKAFDEREAKKGTSAKTNGKATKGKKKDAGDMADLAALIQQRQRARAGNFFDQLETKYAPTSRSKKRATPMDEPPEELFEAAAERHKKLKQSRAKKPSDEDEMEAELDEDDVGESGDDNDDEEEEEAPRRPKKRGRLQRGRRHAKTKA